MILKSIEIQGFKSFPDRIVLEFGKGITAVVGPNGAGKSNILDAIRWVLGEQSSKALRGAKMEDVIFGGTEKRKALGFAEVTLRLDNRDRNLDKDTDEVAVTRRYFRSGESEYKINGEVVRLRDINELFMDTGLGRDGYSMVSQGKIADLVSARSTQRRDMLEEAAGISHFRYRRADANRRLEQAEENLIRLRDILQELESRMGPLKTQSEKAVKFLALAGEKKVLEIGLWLHTIEKSSNDLREQESKFSIATAQYEDVEKNLEEVEEQIELAIKQGQDLTVEVENLTRVISESEEQAAVTEGKIAVEKNTISHNELTIERLSADMGDGEKSGAEIDEEIEKAKADIAEKTEKINEKKQKLASELEKLNSLLGQNGENSEKVKKVNDSITAATLKLSDLRVTSSTQTSAAAELKSRIETIHQILDTRKSVIEGLEEEKAKAQEEIDKLKEEENENNNSLDGYKLIIDARQDKADKLHKEIEGLNLDIFQKEARIKMLDDLEKNLDGYAGSVQKVIKEAKKGTMRGIHGTLSQLISTKGEYSVAIETALGAAIQNIVTDDENSAKRAITFLKDNRAGRATFLPLTTVKSKTFTEKGYDKCEGYVAVASDIVECDKKYREIVDSLLGRTVVIDNIDNGIAMAKKNAFRFKIVTLDGQVLNPGGSMTGGSKGSGTGFLSRINEIEELKQDVKILTERLKEKEKSVAVFDREINVANAEIDATKAEINKVQEAIIRAESALKVIQDRYEGANAQVEELKDEKERATERIALAEKESTRAEKEIEKVSLEVEKYNEELISLNEEREVIEHLREKSGEIQNELNVEIVTLNKEIEANNDIIESAKIRKSALIDRSGKLTEEIEGIRAKNLEIQGNIEAFVLEANALHETAKQTEDKISRLIEGRNENEAHSTQLRTRERELNADKEKLGGERARLEERKLSLDHALEATKNKLYDEYQLTFREAMETSEIPEDIPKAQRTLQEIKNKIRALGNVNVGAVEEYKDVSERYEYLSEQLNDVEKSKTELEKLIDELTGKMAERFREQFRLINNEFSKTFRDMFDGGGAELELDDPSDVLECNINIKAQPPGKKIQNIDLLSGGEKGLVAVSLLFAILKINPAPFCIFDEVEAALDEVNVSRYAKYLRSMTNRTQFILITHRRGAMEEADILYGVTMQEQGVSKMLELKSYEMAKKLGLE